MVQKFNDRVKVKNDLDIWMILEHETIRKGATTKVTGKVKCRNTVSGVVKFLVRIAVNWLDDKSDDLL